MKLIIVNNALSNVVSAERVMIGLIFNRFRCFLSKKATKLIPTAYYYGYIENLYFHKKIVQNIKLHLFNNYKNKDEVDIDIPNNVNDEVWWALSKRFNWNEVHNYIVKMDKYEINFDKTLDGIKKDIKNVCVDKPILKKYFSKLMLHIDDLIDDFEKSVDSDVSSEEFSSQNDSESKDDADE